MSDTINLKDAEVIRRLAAETAEIAALPVHKMTAERWRALNDLRPVKPMVWMDEVPWNEMDVERELTLRCEDPFARNIELSLRRTIYSWRHMPGDMAVDPVYYAPPAVSDSGFGIEEKVRIVKTDPENTVVSRAFTSQFRNEADIAKIMTPKIEYDAARSEADLAKTRQLLGGCLPAEMRGIVHAWTAPWDILVTWWGVEPVLTDLVLRPELVHAAVSRLVDAYLSRLDQWENLNLLAWSEGNHRVGSGGLGYASDLPAPGFDARRVRPIDQWGCAAAQIFSDVSPAMHEEFALRYERRWLERFGLNYYGCCDALHNKIDILKSIPRLRKISMSPWADIDKGAAAIGTDFVFSWKPNPAILAEERWDPERARAEIRDALQRTRGLAVEIIMKDISTVHHEPRRLWEWARIAVEEAESFAESDG
ncbi:MAG: hypothetical protein SCM96_00935 [Acidobacteriota bacterium]|nr:hypothetical protein [Acidobacteriota bacterium]